MIEAGGIGWGAPVVMGGFALFALAGGLLVVRARRARAPMLPLVLFSSPTFAAATAVGFSLHHAPSVLAGSGTSPPE